MIATAQTTDSVKQYKKLLLEARELRTKLRAEIGLRTYQIMAILMQVFNDQDFRADHPSGDGKPADDLKAGQVLDDFVFDDTGLEFLQLRAMLDHYPHQRQWKSGRLQRMYRDMMAARRGSPVRKERPKEVLTKAEFEAVRRASERQRVMLESANKQIEAARENAVVLQSQCDQAEAAIEEAVSEVEKLRRRVRELEAENSTLREENASLRKRLAVTHG